MRNFAIFLSLVIVFLIPLENTITIGAFGTLVKATGIFLALIWLYSSLSSGGFRKLHPFHIIAFLFIEWNIVSILWSIEVDETIIRIKTYVQLGILSWILWDLYTTQNSLNKSLQAYVFGGYISLFSAFHNFFLGQEIGERYAAKGFNPNDYGLILALGIPIAYHIASSVSNLRKNKWLRLFNYTYIPAALVAILLTASRGALLAVVPALFYIFIKMRRLFPFSRLIIIIGIFLSIFVLQNYIPQDNLQRLATIDDSIGKGDLGGRVNIWNTTIDYFIRHPFIGNGSGTIPAAHNVFLSILAETGLIGFFLFGLLLMIATYEALRQERHYVWLWLTVLAVWNTGALVHNWESRKPTWLFLSLVVISASLFRRSDRVDKNPPLSNETSVK